MSVSGSPYRLFRVDDRLLHGQVALGWGRVLRPRHYIVVDEAISRDPQAAAFYELAAPEDTSVLVLSPAQFLQPAGPLPDPRQSVLLVRSIAVAALLLRSGVPGPLNLGGMHAHAGAREIYPFFFLNPEEEDLAAALASEGFELFAQDLPQNPRHESAEWFRGGR